MPALGAPLGGIPSLRLGDVSRDPDPQPSADSAKPKLGFGMGLGLDLSKAQQLQQQQLALAEEKKDNARKMAGQAMDGFINPNSSSNPNRMSNVTPD